MTPAARCAQCNFFLGTRKSCPVCAMRAAKEKDRIEVLASYRKRRIGRPKSAGVPRADVPPAPSGRYTLREHQEAAIREWESNGRRGVVEMATGTGKTIVAIHAILTRRHGQCVVIAVPTIELTHQWKDAITEWTTIPANDIGILGGKSKILPGEREIVITTYASLKKDDTKAAISKLRRPPFFVFDECHHAGANLARSILEFAHKDALGLSATPERWLETPQESYLNRLGGVVYRLSVWDAQEKGLLAPYEYRVIPIDLNAQEQQEWKNHTDGIMTAMQAVREQDGDVEILDVLSMLEKRREVAEHEPYRTLLYHLYTRRRIIHDCEAKRAAIPGILQEIRDRKSFLFHLSHEFSEQTAAEARKLHIPCAVHHSGVHQDERRAALKSFKAGTIRAISTVETLTEGVDAPDADTAVFVASKQSERQYIQRLGRVLRRNPEDPEKRALVCDFFVRGFDDQARVRDLDPEFRGLIRGEARRVLELESTAMASTGGNETLLAAVRAYFLTDERPETKALVARLEIAIGLRGQVKSKTLAEVKQAVDETGTTELYDAWWLNEVRGGLALNARDAYRPNRPSLLRLAVFNPEALEPLAALAVGDLRGFLEAYHSTSTLRVAEASPRSVAIETLLELEVLNEYDRTALAEIDESTALSTLTRILATNDPLKWNHSYAEEVTVSHTGRDIVVSADRLAYLIDDEQDAQARELDEALRTEGEDELEKRGVSLFSMRISGDDVARQARIVRLRREEPIRGTLIDANSHVTFSQGRGYGPVAEGRVLEVRADSLLIQLTTRDLQWQLLRGILRVDVSGESVAYQRQKRLLAHARGKLPADEQPKGAQHVQAALGVLSKKMTQPYGTSDIAFFGKGLNEAQRRAVACTLNARHAYAIQGPPGTGKTTVIVELLFQLAAAGKRVLVATETNAALDNVIDRFTSAGGYGIRVGPTGAATRDSVVPYTMDQYTSDWRSALRNTSVFFATTASAGHDRYQLPEFDIVLLDEATQCTMPSALLAMSRARKYVFVGDHEQLAPLVKDHDVAKRGLDVSPLEQFLVMNAFSHGRMLSVQYRMRPEILEIANRAIYEGRILNGRAPAQRNPMKPLALVTYSSRISHERKDGNGSAYNHLEAELARDIATRLQTRGQEVVIITPYGAQRDLLRSYGLQVRIGTVDSFQGSEARVVIFSLVRSNNREEIGFLKDRRRMNVALTRAQDTLIVLADGAILGSEAARKVGWHALLEVSRDQAAHLQIDPETRQQAPELVEAYLAN